jgi:hypothetical protein
MISTQSRSNSKFISSGTDENDLWRGYTGEIIDQVKHGKGTLIYTNGDIYVGHFSFDKKHGKGKYLSKMGTNYDGDWADDVKHGWGEQK